MLKAKNMTEAWDLVNLLFPTDYKKDEERSLKVGYPIYRSTVEGRYYDYICDLNDRLEINLEDGNKTVNIWVEQTVEEQKAEEEEIQKGIEAREAARELGKEAHLLLEPEQYTEITLVIDGSRWNHNSTERKVYDGLKRGERWLAGDLITSYCENHDIWWGTIKDVKCQHYEHGKDGENGGHFVISGYVGIRKD